MAFDPDAYLADTAPAGGGFDPDAYLKETGGARETTDMGPEARRARAGRPAAGGERAGSFQPATEAQARAGADPLMIDPGLDLRDAPGDTSLFPSSKPFAPGSHEAQAAALNLKLPADQREGVNPGWHGIDAFSLGTTRNPDADPLASNIASGLAAHGAGVVTRGALNATPLVNKLPNVIKSRILPAAVEGGTASTAQGGSFAAGAGLGGGLAALGPALRAAAGGRNVVKDVTRGATKAPKRLAEDVKFKAQDGQLTEVLSELPDARRAVMTKARTNPGAAAETVDGVVSKAVDASDADFAAMQRQHGGVPLQPLAERLAGLEERLNLQGRGVAADAVNRVRTDLLKRYGSTPEGLESAKLTAQQIRNIRNDMGTVIDPARTIKPNTRRDALGRIYGILNKEIEDVAENTRGVDVAALRKRNRQISTLIPVRDALKARAESEGERGIIAKAKALPGDAVRRTLREVDYYAGDAATGARAAVAPAAAGSAQDRPAPVGVPVGFVAAMRGEQP